ncbi:MAG: hypothetical protein J6S85_19105 [Methanobrevibacter sp.]|nr:hypothetical protein [Methanobrevibacter sp.]
MATGTAIALAASVGVSAYSAIEQSKANRESLDIQKSSLAEQRKELDRQKRIEIEQQKRENEQLMNSVSNLTNTSYSGVSSPSVDYDKYGDMG